MLNIILALALMLALFIVVIGFVFFMAWVGWNILLIMAFLLLFAVCYDFVDHMRNG